MRLDHFHLICGDSARQAAGEAGMSFRIISPQLRSLLSQWDSEFCLQLLLARFGAPSYRVNCAEGLQALVWALHSRRPDNIIAIHVWPRLLPQGFHLFCRHWNGAVVDFCLWLTCNHLQRQLVTARKPV